MGDLARATRASQVRQALPLHGAGTSTQITSAARVALALFQVCGSPPENVRASPVDSFWVDLPSVARAMVDDLGRLTAAALKADGPTLIHHVVPGR